VEVEAVLGKCMKDLKKRKAKKVDGAGGTALRSAGEVVELAIGKGWMR
jgi:hypothetical protein